MVDVAPAQYPHVSRSFGKEKGENTLKREELEMTPPVPQELTMWNSIVSKISFCLLLPTAVAVVVVVAFTATTLWADVRKWMEPVRTTMINEEIANLAVRCHESSSPPRAFLEASLTPPRCGMWRRSAATSAPSSRRPS